MVCCDEKGGAAFQLLRHRRNEPRAFLYVFDLLELNGTGLRREPIEVPKATAGEHPAREPASLPDYSPSGSGHSIMSTCPQSMH